MTLEIEKITRSDDANEDTMRSFMEEKEINGANVTSFFVGYEQNGTRSGIRFNMVENIRPKKTTAEEFVAIISNMAPFVKDCMERSLIGVTPSVFYNSYTGKPGILIYGTLKEEFVYERGLCSLVFDAEPITNTSMKFFVVALGDVDYAHSLVSKETADRAASFANFCTKTPTPDISEKAARAFFADTVEIASSLLGDSVVSVSGYDEWVQFEHDASDSDDKGLGVAKQLH